MAIFFIHFQDSFPLVCQFQFKFLEVNLICLNIGQDYSKKKEKEKIYCVNSVSDDVDTATGRSGGKGKWLIVALRFCDCVLYGTTGGWTWNKDLYIQKARDQLEQIFILVSKLLFILVYYL